MVHIFEQCVSVTRAVFVTFQQGVLVLELITDTDMTHYWIQEACGLSEGVKSRLPASCSASANSCRGRT